MDRAEARNILWWIKVAAETTMDREALDLAIEALSEPTVSEKESVEDDAETATTTDCDDCIRNTCNYNKIDWEVSEDCISREYIKNVISTYFSERGDFGSSECFWILKAIKNAPSVVVRKNRTTDHSGESTERELIGDCNICRFAACSECDDCINGSQWVRMTREDEE